MKTIEKQNRQYISKTKYKVNDTIKVVKTLVFNPDKKLVDTRYTQYEKR